MFIHFWTFLMEPILFQVSPLTRSHNAAVMDCMFPYLKYYCCELWQFNYYNLKTNRSLISVMFFLYLLPEGKWHCRKSHEALGAAVVVEAFWFGTSGPEALIQKLTNGEKWEASWCYSFWFTAACLSVCKVTSRSICKAVFLSDCCMKANTC